MFILSFTVFNMC